MAKGSGIICSAEPGGVRLEGTISGALKPGTIVQKKAGTAPVGGRFTYEAYNPAADGNQRPIYVLLPDELQGKLATDAYTDGDRCFVYVPIAGEELNILAYAAGTASDDAVAIGDLFIVDKGTGHLVATTGTPESEPFEANEAITDLTSTAELVWMTYTGY